VVDHHEGWVVRHERVLEDGGLDKNDHVLNHDEPTYLEYQQRVTCEVKLDLSKQVNPVQTS